MMSYGEMKAAYRNFILKYQYRKHNLRDLNVDGRIILIFISIGVNWFHLSQDME
jgi:hypothetical protein